MLRFQIESISSGMLCSAGLQVAAANFARRRFFRLTKANRCSTETGWEATSPPPPPPPPMASRNWAKSVFLTTIFIRTIPSSSLWETEPALALAMASKRLLALAFFRHRGRKSRRKAPFGDAICFPSSILFSVMVCVNNGRNQNRNRRCLYREGN